MRLKPLPPDVGVILVDHGSKLREANDMLDDVVRIYQEATGTAIVEPAHMELAEPTLDQAFARCVERGAKRVIVQPYFLSPGRHSRCDIPRMAAEAARAWPGVECRVAEPLGLDIRMGMILHERIWEAMEREPDKS